MVYFNMGSLREEEKKSSWVDNNRLLFNHESSKEKIFILVEGIVIDVSFIKYLTNILIKS